MKTWVRAASPVSRPVAALLATSLLLLLGSCGGGNGGSGWPAFLPPGNGSAGPGTTTPPPEPVVLTLRTLSSRPDMATGGDALVEVALPEGVAAADVRVTRNGDDVTSAFSPQPDGRALRGLVAGLAVGENTLAATAGTRAAGKLAVTNHPLTGPVFSGPHLTPFECRTTVAGLGAALDADCSAATTFDWFYFTPAGARKVLADPLGPRPADLATATTRDGKTVPFIVRVESGTLNRSIYRIAVLDDPQEAGRWNPAGWNRRVVFRFGESTAAQYNQGSNTLDEVFKADTIDQQSIQSLQKGYAYVLSTLNINKVNVNDVLAAETAMMLREHIAERYGVPRWVVGMGGSGGAIQQLLIAQNYPESSTG
ncbi:DUF6351 family protein (plasmid) [Variovorax sp. EBFNA2]|nr:DUF6351 family protein [Variovorax boronicumulans]WPG41015.1 DUF6351 family protein [Variovorax boronicumulans]